jgi:hypothetical protein
MSESKQRIQWVKPSEIGGVMCGWADCQTGVEFRLGLVPEGWRALVISKYSLLEREGVMNADRDMMLCPVHVEALKRLLKHYGR